MNKCCLCHEPIKVVCSAELEFTLYRSAPYHRKCVEHVLQNRMLEDFA